MESLGKNPIYTLSQPPCWGARRPARAQGPGVIKIPLIGRVHAFRTVERNCRPAPLASCGGPLRKAESSSGGRRLSGWSLAVAVSTLERPKEIFLSFEGRGLIPGTAHAYANRESLGEGEVMDRSGVEADHPWRRLTVFEDEVDFLLLPEEITTSKVVWNHTDFDLTVLEIQVQNGWEGLPIFSEAPGGSLFLPFPASQGCQHPGWTTLPRLKSRSTASSSPSLFISLCPSSRLHAHLPLKRTLSMTQMLQKHLQSQTRTYICRVPLVCQSHSRVLEIRMWAPLRGLEDTTTSSKEEPGVTEPVSKWRA